MLEGAQLVKLEIIKRTQMTVKLPGDREKKANNIARLPALAGR